MELAWLSSRSKKAKKAEATTMKRSGVNVKHFNFKKKLYIRFCSFKPSSNLSTKDTSARLHSDDAGEIIQLLRNKTTDCGLILNHQFFSIQYNDFREKLTYGMSLSRWIDKELVESSTYLIKCQKLC